MLRKMEIQFTSNGATVSVYRKPKKKDDPSFIEDESYSVEGNNAAITKKVADILTAEHK